MLLWCEFNFGEKTDEGLRPIAVGKTFRRFSRSLADNMFSNHVKQDTEVDM